MSKTRSKRGWSPLELGLLAVMIVLLCVAAVVTVVVVGDFALWENEQLVAKETRVAVSPTAIATLPPLTSAPGATISVQGQGWPAQSRVIIYLVPVNPPSFAINSAIVDANGQFAVEVIVPFDPRWLAESPVPVLAELDDGSLSAQAMLNISTPTGGSPAITPIPAASVQQPTPTLAPPAAGAANLTVNANALNVRQGPGTTYPVRGVLLNGQQAEITGRNADTT